VAQKRSAAHREIGVFKKHPAKKVALKREGEKSKDGGGKKIKTGTRPVSEKNLKWQKGAACQKRTKKGKETKRGKGLIERGSSGEIPVGNKQNRKWTDFSVKGGVCRHGFGRKGGRKRKKTCGQDGPSLKKGLLIPGKKKSKKIQ